MRDSHRTTSDRSDDGAHALDADRDPGHPDRADRSRERDVVTPDRKEVVARERAEHGGIKIGSAFFGFLTAVGVGVLLTAIATAAGAAVGLSTGTTSASSAKSSADTIGIVSGIVLLVVLFVAYYCGGYVAARMARFDGIKQGVAVWVWAIVVAIVVAVLGAVFGSKYNVLSQLNSFPRIPVSEGDLTTGGIIALVAVLLATLLGAIVGGLAGMRFHRKVDKTGLGR
ncbi:hypothetical protein [Marmoricola sp. Leaf446]|uniref:hypothetical protein n=1 Tax=Marmoricola sp. Leaf446 TaxID=1736379 RepID=UPI000A6EDF3E|nr:hypothetical protein [Marmoricola sp. Leaf446]